jgi:hypothetical protein
MTKLESFKEKANIKYKDKFDYGLITDIQRLDIKVKIICPIHGEFTQTPEKHLAGKYGCKRCGELASAKAKESTLEVYLQKARAVHGDYYDYSKTVYTSIYDKFTFICPIHGEFQQLASGHLAGYNCIKCRSISLNSFITRANKKHSNKYDYSKVSFRLSKDYITIICPVHGAFEQRVDSHLRGSSCPDCSSIGFDKTKPAILYYLKINGGQAYKIGITNRTVEERFTKSELQCIEILATKYYNIGEEAYITEQQVLKEYKEYQYSSEKLLLTGNTELFIKDIFNLDTKQLPI